MILIHKETAEIFELFKCDHAPYILIYDSEGWMSEGVSCDFEILGWL